MKVSNASLSDHSRYYQMFGPILVQRIVTGQSRIRYLILCTAAKGELGLRFAGVSLALRLALMHHCCWLL